MIVVRINLNTWDMCPLRLDAEWIRHRIGIFYRFTFLSLVYQSCRDFVCQVVYADDSRDVVREVVTWYPWADWLRWVPRSKLRAADIETLRGHDRFTIARVDSDDMYHRDYLGIVAAHDWRPGEQAILPDAGYIYDVATGRVAEYYDRSPPFYAERYDVADYLAGHRHPHRQGHNFIRDDLQSVMVSGRMYCVVVHGGNITTGFDANRRRGNMVDSTVLQEFGI
jgi:hypothetical protein